MELGTFEEQAAIQVQNSGLINQRISSIDLYTVYVR